MKIRISADRTLHTLITEFSVKTSDDVCDEIINDTDKYAELFRGRELLWAVYTSFSDIVPYGAKLNIVTENGEKKLVCRVNTEYMISNILLIRSDDDGLLSFDDDYIQDNEN